MLAQVCQSTGQPRVHQVTLQRPYTLDTQQHTTPSSLLRPSWRPCAQPCTPPCARANVRADTLHTCSNTSHTLAPLSLAYTRTRTAVARNATPRALQQRIAHLAALGTLQHHSRLGLLSRLFRLFRPSLARRLVWSPMRTLALWETHVTLPRSLSPLTHSPGLQYSTSWHREHLRRGTSVL